MRCKDCKHWVAKTHEDQNCACPKLHYGGAPAADELAYGDYNRYCAYLFTGPEFGCVHFERREE